MQQKNFNGESYKSVLDNHIFNIHVERSEMREFRFKLHDLLAMFGIITYESILNKRKEPYHNSPYGKYINYINDENGKRKHIDSFILNDYGKKTVEDILKKYASDRWLYKNKLSHIQDAQKEVYMKPAEGVLIHWLKAFEIEYKDLGDTISINMDKNHFTYYKNSNLITSGKGKNDSPFWFIMKNNPIPTKQNDAILANEILQCHYELTFEGKSKVWMVEADFKKDKKSDEILELEKRIAQLEKMLGVQNLKDDTKPSVEDIKKEIKGLAEPIKTKSHLKEISINQVNKLSGDKKEELQAAFHYLNKRNLLDAVNAPDEGWRYNFNNKSVELLCRIDKRASAVYDVRHRYIQPMILGDGSLIKEMAQKEEGEKKFKLPYGLDRINYRNKTIFIVEGVFDGCFIKNSLAITTAVMPHDMRKVIDIFRKNGFQIIHIPDNFRAGDKGGKAALREYAKSDNDIFMPGDLVFNWEIWEDLKDINEVAMHHGWSEIDAKMILEHTWSHEDMGELIKFS